VVETDSTNTELLALAKNGEYEGLWVRAERQTAGRGRIGRHWISPVGNLYVSGLVRLKANDPPAATLGFVAAIALQKIISLYVPHAAIQLKWPNDVLADGAKLSGILLERTDDAVVIGIGVNLASHPNLSDRLTSSIAELTGKATDPEVFLDVLVEAFGHILAQWRADGLGPILLRWQELAHPVGAPLNVSLPDGASLKGIYKGLDASGALKLCLADGSVRAIHAGDVFLV
jgi:BirA family transcriptional regulator, biotin operon repressor / biotin---[acetyl-CoA-carboxylase] ligase